MKRAGCGVAIAGLLCGIASFAFLGNSIFRAMRARAVRVIPLAPGVGVDSGFVRVATDRFCRIAMRATVRSEHARPETGDGGGWDLQYAFPFRYTVFDAVDGVVLAEEKDFASDSGMRTQTQLRVTEAGGSAHVEQGYEKFAAPPPGEIRVEAHLESDRDFGAELESAELVIYDNVSKHTRSVAAGIGLLVAAGLLMGLGALLYIVAAVRNAAR